MLKDILILFIANLMEVIHVELSDKGAEVAVAEVDREDFLLEAVNVKDGEVGSVFVPGGYGGVGLILNGRFSTWSIS